MVERVIELSALFFGIDESDICGESHKSVVCNARHIAWYYLHKEKKVPISALISRFGRVKSVVYDGINKIGYYIEYDSSFKDTYNDFKSFVEEYL